MERHFDVGFHCSPIFVSWMAELFENDVTLALVP